MTSNSALQHRCCQSASVTDQSCCADNSLTAGLCHCNIKFEKLLLAQRPATVHCNKHPGNVHTSLIRADVQNRAESRQQACVTASVLLKVCCLHRGTMISDSELQHRSCQSASLTDQSCCADNSLTAGLWHCHVCLRRCCPHNDQQQCTAAQILPKCILH